MPVDKPLKKRQVNPVPSVAPPLVAHAVFISALPRVDYNYDVSLREDVVAGESPLLYDELDIVIVDLGRVSTSLGLDELL
jgi:hypothetical protein